jgi:hypothetical protein
MNALVAVIIYHIRLRRYLSMINIKAYDITQPTKYTILWSTEKFVFKIHLHDLAVSAILRGSLLILQEDPQGIYLPELLQRYS